MLNWLIIFGAKYFIYLLIIAAILFGLSLARETKRRFVVFGFLALSFTGLFDLLASKLYFNPRPFVVDKIVPLIYHAPTNGFPSDHTILATTLAVIVFRFNKKLGVMMFGLAFVVGASRVLAGVHHWLDIFAGVLLPILGGLISSLIIKYYIKPQVIV